MPLAFMFPGQGSHYYQMGRELFDGHAAFREQMVEMDKIVVAQLGCSMIDVLYSDDRQKDDLFDRTPLTNAAIFMVEYALAKSLIADHVVPDVLVGASMGMFAAAAIASAIAFEDALVATIKLGLILEERCHKGAMVALLASDKLYEDMEALSKGTELAALNYDSHFVVSTTYDYITTLEPILNGKQIPYGKLPVSHAFHSRWIDDAEQAALQLFSGLRYSPTRTPLVCCAQTQAIRQLTAGDLWSALRRTIRFSATTARLERRGPHCYIDVGATGTLVTFLRRGQGPSARSRTIPILTPFGTGLKNYQALTSQRGELENAMPEHSR
nr:acyltransferase domain-containing protein [Bradyrhizobium diazoefficiens]